MANENLPAVFNKQNGVLNIVKRYIDKLSSKSSNKQIIDNFSSIKQYGVLSMPAFKMITDEMIQNSPSGTIIMADINDLFVANKFRGKEKVNDMLKSMINKIKDSLEENECKNYKMGKMGDEIYIYLPDKNEQESDKIVNNLSIIKESELTISVGSCSDLTKGLVNAMNNADEKMAGNKGKFKSERLKKICGNNLEKIVDSIVETQLDKMRINLNQLKASNKPDLRNTFEKAIEQIDIDQIVTNANNKQNEKQKDDTDNFSMLKNKYTEEAKMIYGNNPKLINEYVLANMLSKHPVNGVITSEFFQGLGHKKAYKNMSKDTKAKNISMLAVDLSGLKVINDTLGHDEGDKAIYDSLEYVKAVLASKNVKMYSEIVAKSGGNSYVIIEQTNDKNENEILNSLQKYGITNGSKYNMSIMCSMQNIDKKNLNKSNFLSVLNDNLTKAENTLQNESFNRKLNDVEEIKNSIGKIYQQIINMDDIQLLLKNDTNQKNKILNIIKTGFENCINKERDSSHLNKSQNVISFEKESKTHGSKVLKPLEIN